MTPRFVVAQVGRTGSGYIAAVLSAAGIPTGHEGWWNPTGVRDDGIVGDSSWCAVPHLACFDGIVFHQVREPLATLRSLIDEGIGTDWDTPYTRLRHEIIGGPSGDPLLDVMRCWVTMNAEIEWHAERRWRVEDVDDDLVRDIAARVGVEVDVFAAAAAIASTSKTTNKHHIPTDFGWSGLPAGEWLDRTREMASRYGYDV